MHSNIKPFRPSSKEISQSLAINPIRKPSRLRKYIYLLVIIVLILVFSITIRFKRKPLIAVLARNDSIKKPLTDSRLYEVVLLQNRIQVMLISDKEAARSGMSMTVGVGSSHDPPLFPFSVQLTQYLLMHCSSSFSFNKVLSEFYGSLSYHITEEHSSYYFDIDSAGFADALESFMSLFSSEQPFELNTLEKDFALFKLKYKKLIANADTNINYIVDSVITGREGQLNDQALSLGDSIQVFSELNRLYSEYYTAENMRIVLISRDSLDKLRHLANNLFKSHPQSSKPPIQRNQLKHKDLMLAKLIMFTSNSIAKPKLTLTFFSGEHNMNKASILEYYVYMLKGITPGSLYFDLHRRELIEAMDFSIKKSSLYGNKLVVSIILKQQGLDQVQTVIVKTLNYFKAIDQQGDSVSHSYNDIREILFKKFAYLTIDKYSSYLTQLSQNMLEASDKSDLDQIFLNQYALPEFNSDIIGRDLFQVDNVVITLGLNEVLPGDSYLYSFLKEEREAVSVKNRKRWMLYDYYKANILIEDLKSVMTSSYHYTDSHFFRVKRRSMFLTQLSHIVAVDGTKDEMIREVNDYKPDGLFLNISTIQLHYKVDRTFKVPRVHSYFHLLFPDVRPSDPKVYWMKERFANHLLTLIDLNIDEARYCGNAIQMNLDENGINIVSVAYEDVYYKILRMVIDYIVQSKQGNEFSEIDFLSRRHLSLEDKSLAYLGFALKPNAYMTMTLDKNWQSSDELSQFWKKTVNNIYIRGLLYGVVSKELREQVAKLFIDKVEASSPQMLLDSLGQSRDIEEGLKYLFYTRPLLKPVVIIIRLKEKFESTDSYVCLSFFRLNSSTEGIIPIAFAHVWNDYTQENKEMQMDVIDKDGHSYLRILSLSHSTRPELLNEELNDTLHQFGLFLQFMSGSYQAYHRQVLQRKLSKKDLRLRYKAKRAWNEIYHGTLTYSSHQQLVDSALTWTKEDLSQLYNQIVVHSPQRITFQFYPNENDTFSLDKEKYSLNESLTATVYNSFNIN